MSHRLPTLIKAARLLTLVVLLLSASIATMAQDTSQYDKGTPPQHSAGVSPIGSYMSTDLGTVNLGNGSLNFQIPLGQVAGRGFSVPMTLNYSSKVWSASKTEDYNPAFEAWYPAAYADYLNSRSGGGWNIGAAPRLMAQSQGFSPGTCPGSGCGGYLKALTKLTVKLPDKGEVELRDDAYDGSPLGTQADIYGVNRLDSNRGQRWHATDGSGLIFISDAANGVVKGDLNGVLITSDGTRYRFTMTYSGSPMIVSMGVIANCSSITDRNGNQITITYPSSTEVRYTDQLGRTTKIQYNVADPANSTVTLAVLVTLPGYDGAAQGPVRYYKIKQGVMNQNYRSGINPQLPVINGDYDPQANGYSWGVATRLFAQSDGAAAEQIDNRLVYTELVLPDDRSLRFRYNEYGEVAEVEMPTGGKVQYDYAYDNGLPTGNSLAVETKTTNRINTDVSTIDRAVVARRTYANGTTLESSWTYNYGPQTAPNAASYACTEVKAMSGLTTGPLMLSQRHFYLTAQRYINTTTGEGTGYSLWSTGVEWRAETRNATNVVMNASEQDWSQRAAVVWTNYPQEQPVNDNRVNESRNILDDGKVARVTTLYDQYNNTTEVKQYNYDATLERRTTTSYLNSNTTGGVTYNYQSDDAIRLLRLPAQQALYDSASVERSRTVYAYDNYTGDGNNAAMLDYGVMTGHDAGYGISKLTRGNLTRVGRWLDIPTPTTIYSYSHYDEVGNVVSVKDARGNVSTISYTDDYGVGSSPGSGVSGTYGATYALPTLKTTVAPAVGQATHTARSQYDFLTGQLTGFKDRNGVITQTIYDDEYNRPTQVKTGLGLGVENHAAMYYAPATVFGITLANNDILTTGDLSALDDGLLRSWTKTDGFGRTTETWSEDPAGDVKVLTVYDALGRTRQTSNPYRPSLGQTALYTTSVYDLAGGVTTRTTPDNAVVTTAYSGNVVTITDPAGKDRQSISDALGRLTQVIEDPGTGGLAYSTTYDYDALDNLVTVTQGSQTRTFVYDSLKRLTSVIHPESGTTAYVYDNNGNLTKKTDARATPVQTNYSYDALNRVTLKNYSDTTPDVSYYYDAQTLPTGAPTFTRGSSTGRLVGVTYGGTSSGSYYGYDSLGRRLTTVQRTDSLNYAVDATYNKAGGMLTETYPLVPGQSVRRVVEYGYDATGRLSDLTSDATSYGEAASASAISYAAHGGLASETLGNTLKHAITYNNKLQPTQIKLGTTATPTSVLNLTYNYGTTTNNGNVLDLSNVIGTSTTKQIYTYDALNRISTTQETNGSTTTYWTQTNGYDRYSNRWEVIAGSPSMTFNSQNRIVGRSYDGAGNLLGDGLHTYTYDAENKIISVDAVSAYKYDGEGRRVRKLLGENLRFVYDMHGSLIAEFDGATGAWEKEYIHGADGLVATIEPTTGTRYMTADHLGTPRVVTNSAGTVISRHDYKPFGEELFVGSGNRTALQGYSVADGVRQKFTEYERDNETGLDYAQARYYASSQGRFTSIDPALESAKLEMPQSWNRYTYALNNPLYYIDPDGELWIATGNQDTPYSWVDSCPEGQQCFTIALVYSNNSLRVYGSNNADDIINYQANASGMIDIRDLSGHHNANYTVAGGQSVPEEFLSPLVAANLFAVAHNYGEAYPDDEELVVTAASASSGHPGNCANGPCHAGHDGNEIDLRYMGADGRPIQASDAYSDADVNRTTYLIRQFRRSNLDEAFTGDTARFGSTQASERVETIHHNHLHVGVSDPVVHEAPPPPRPRRRG